MLNFIVAMVLMIKFSGLPVWMSIAIITCAAIADYFYHIQQMNIEHMRFMTIEKGIMNIIYRITGTKE